MAKHHVAAEFVTDAKRALQIHPIARFERAQCRQRQTLGRNLDDVTHAALLRRRFHHGEAAAVVRDAGANLDTSGVIRAGDGYGHTVAVREA